jgi:hypothetical protein
MRTLAAAQKRPATGRVGQKDQPWFTTRIADA